MVTECIKINEDKFLKEYKDIVKLCLKEGEQLPTLLSVIDVPEKYDFTDKERSKLKETEEARNSRVQQFLELEEKLASVKWSTVKELDEGWNTIHNEELMSFIGRHPEYQKLIKQ